MAAHSQRPQCAEEWEQRLSSSNPTFMDQDRQEGLVCVCVGGVHGVGEQTRRHGEGMKGQDGDLSSRSQVTAVKGQNRDDQMQRKP